jgi:hypothetical protein
MINPFQRKNVLQLGAPKRTNWYDSIAHLTTGEWLQSFVTYPTAKAFYPNACMEQDRTFYLDACMEHNRDKSHVLFAVHF